MNMSKAAKHFIREWKNSEKPQNSSKCFFFPPRKVLLATGRTRYHHSCTAQEYPESMKALSYSVSRTESVEISVITFHHHCSS